MLANNQPATVDPASVDLNRPPSPVLSDSELETVLATSDDPRELALLSLLGATGLRLVDVPRLQADGWVRRADGSVVLSVPPRALDLGRLALVPADVAARVDAYLEDPGRPAVDHGPIFFGDGGRPLSCAETGFIVLHAIARAGLDARAFVRVDGLRLRFTDVFAATFAARYLRRGGELEGLRRCFGHRDLRQTRRLVTGLLSAGVSLPSTSA